MAYNKYENLFRWGSTKLWLHEKFSKNNQSKWFVPRGAIYSCHLGENVGYEKSGLTGRPVLVVTNDSLNKTSGNVVVIPLSKNIKWDQRALPKKKLKQNSHYVLYNSKYKKLNYDSSVQCEDIRSVSKSRLGTFICFVEPDDMTAIRKKLKYTLQI